MKNSRLLRKAACVSVWGLVSGLLIAGCGGGGGGGSGSGGSVNTVSPPGTAVSDYIADEESGSFTGNWYVGNYATTTAASATAFTETLAATSQPNAFSATNNFIGLINGTWSQLTLSNGPIYHLAPNGWALSTNDMVGNTFVDSGDGTNAAYVLASGASYNYSITRASLAGSPIVCSGTCVTPGAYPAGSASYSLTYTSNFYDLYDLPNGDQVTDQNGIALTGLPAANATTFCDPVLGTVYSPNGTQMSTNGWSYNVYFLASGTTCTTVGAITAALGSAPQYWVTITWTPTGNASVPTVLVLTNWYPIYPNMASYGFINPWFYSARAGYVWEGIMLPAGTVDGTKNKAAVNAELSASGYAPIP